MKYSLFVLLLLFFSCQDIKNANQLSDAIKLVSEKFDTKIKYQDNLSPDVPTLSLEFKNKTEKYDLFESRLVYNCFEVLQSNKRQYIVFEVKKNKDFNFYSTYDLDRISQLKVCSERYLNSLLSKSNDEAVEIDTSFLKANQFEEAEELIQEHITKIEFKGFKTGESQGVSMIQIYYSINSKDDLTYLVFDAEDGKNKLIGFGINP
jgi:hypothetical protein